MCRRSSTAGTSKYPISRPVHVQSTDRESLLVLEETIVHFPMPCLFARTQSRFCCLECMGVDGLNRCVLEEITNFAGIHVVRHNLRQHLIRVLYTVRAW